MRTLASGRSCRSDGSRTLVVEAGGGDRRGWGSHRTADIELRSNTFLRPKSWGWGSSGRVGVLGEVIGPTGFEEKSVRKGRRPGGRLNEAGRVERQAHGFRRSRGLATALGVP